MLITADKAWPAPSTPNLIKAAQSFVRERAGKSVELTRSAARGANFFGGGPLTSCGERHAQPARGASSRGGRRGARDITRRFIEDEGIDKVFLVYSEFKSVLSQRAVVEQILPVSRVVEQAEEAEAPADPSRPVTYVDYIYEQPPEDIFSQLLPRLIETQIYRALLESVASEQGARMTAMDSASKNAFDLIAKLTLNMNRVRQAGITREIIEIVSGASVQ